MTEQIDATKNQPQKDFNPWVVYAVCFGVSLVFMFFYGINSPIYTFNTHTDYQWYMTMGHGIVSGKVIYRDLFDHKGPLIYTLFAFACLFPDPQFVIWCIEVFLISLFLFFCYRIARKFLSPWLSLLAVPLMMMLLSTNYVRGINGACVEEYCYPIFAYGLLCFLDFIMDRRAPSWRRSLALGICLGILFWTKYTMLEFFIVPMLMWLIINLKERSFLRIVQQGLIMLGGFLLVTLPIIICFAALGALDDLFEVYFLVNIGGYNGDHQTEEDDVFYINPWKNFLFSFIIGTYYIIMLVFGIICYAIYNWKNKKSGLWMLISILTTWLMVGFVCGYGYYYLPLYTYALLGIIYVVKIVAKMLQSVEITIKRRWAAVLGCFIVVLLGFFGALIDARNVSEINRSRDVYVHYKIADMITEYNQTAEQPATLFCYQMADCGFYNTAGLVPNVRFYAESSFTKENFPEMFESFDNTIREQLCDFVVTYRYIYDKNKDFLDVYYHPYINNDITESTLDFYYFEPGGGDIIKIIILFRNE